MKNTYYKFFNSLKHNPDYEYIGYYGDIGIETKNNVAHGQIVPLWGEEESIGTDVIDTWLGERTVSVIQVEPKTKCTAFVSGHWRNNTCLFSEEAKELIMRDGQFFSETFDRIIGIRFVEEIRGQKAKFSWGKRAWYF